MFALISLFCPHGTLTNTDPTSKHLFDLVVLDWDKIFFPISGGQTIGLIKKRIDLVG